MTGTDPGGTSYEAQNMGRCRNLLTSKILLGRQNYQKFFNELCPDLRKLDSTTFTKSAWDDRSREYYLALLWLCSASPASKLAVSLKRSFIRGFYICVI